MSDYLEEKDIEKLIEKNHAKYPDGINSRYLVPLNVKEGSIVLDPNTLKYDDYDDGTNDKKTIVIENPNANNYEFYINPKISHYSKKSLQEGEEGCLSIPEIRIIAERFDKIKVKYFNSEGGKIKKPLSGFLSRLFQHELDHLNGKLMVENKIIKNVYRISDNKNVGELYSNLVNQLSNYK